MSNDIRNIKSWSPGSLMRYDNMHFVSARVKRHAGIGIVVANDGDHTIHVIWDDACHKTWCEYDVRNMNQFVLFHVDG